MYNYHIVEVLCMCMCNAKHLVIANYLYSVTSLPAGMQCNINIGELIKAQHK